MTDTHQRLFDLDGHEGPFAPFRFAIVADPHLRERDGEMKLAYAVEQINATPGIAFVLLLGDLLWDGESSVFRAMMARLSMPWFHVLGNNDRDRAEVYGRELGPLYYALRARGCLFVALWSCVPQQGIGDHQGAMDGAQIAWAQETLSIARERRPPYHHVFLFTHCPVLPDWREPGKYGMRSELARQWFGWCRRFDVSACFFGHVHREYAFERDGTQFVTTASLNWNFDDEDESIQPWWRRPQLAWGAWCVVDVEADDVLHERRRIDWRAVLAAPVRE